MQALLQDTLRDASLYAGVAVLLAVLAMLASPEHRKAMLGLALAAVVFVGGLWLLGRFGSRFDDRTIFEIVREALLALLAVVVFRSVLRFVTRILLARFQIPTIVSDVLVGLALIAYALVRLNAVGVNVAGIVTTSAVITGAIAFSAQEVLGALWAGLALQADRTLRIGDFIRFDGKPGQVIGIRWRTTTIRTRNNEIIIIPNAQLIKDKIHVLARADQTELAIREHAFLVSYDHAPSSVVATVNAALRRIEVPNVASEPAPWCLCLRFDDSGITYAMYFQVLDHGRAREADSEMLGHLYAALQRAGMRIPYPQRDVHFYPEAGPEEAQRLEVAKRVAALEAIGLFGALTAPELQALAAAVRPCLYVGGDRLFRQGDPADCLFVLVRGKLGVFDEQHARGGRNRLATIEPPGYVGEMGLLTGQPRAATVMADEDCECLRLDKAAFDAILRSRPEIVDELSRTLARRQAENDAMLQSLEHGARSEQVRGRARELMQRIRRFFSLGA